MISPFFIFDSLKDIKQFVSGLNESGLIFAVKVPGGRPGNLFTKYFQMNDGQNHGTL